MFKKDAWANELITLSCSDFLNRHIYMLGQPHNFTYNFEDDENTRTPIAIAHINYNHFISLLPLDKNTTNYKEIKRISYFRLNEKNLHDTTLSL